MLDLILVADADKDVESEQKDADAKELCGSDTLWFLLNLVLIQSAVRKQFIFLFHRHLYTVHNGDEHGRSVIRDILHYDTILF